MAKTLKRGLSQRPGGGRASAGAPARCQQLSVDTARAPQARAPPRPVLLGQRWQREQWSLRPCGRWAGSLACGVSSHCAALFLDHFWSCSEAPGDATVTGSLPTEAVSTHGAAAGLWAWPPRQRRGTCPSRPAAVAGHLRLLPHSLLALQPSAHQNSAGLKFKRGPGGGPGVRGGGRCPISLDEEAKKQECSVVTRRRV